MKKFKSHTKKCEWCNEEFKTIDKRKRFCNSSHAASFNNTRFPKRLRKIKEPAKTTYQKWLDGEYSGTTKHGLSDAVRRGLLKDANYVCQDGRSGCNGWGMANPKSGKSCLTVDHIDGDCMNNAKENLVVLCPNCHSMTETYGALNKGSGRKFRYATMV